jgi:hypothetical protein
MPKGDLTVKLGKWSRRGDRCCLRCGTTDRPHMARGYCARCYENVIYHENIDREHRKRKVKRLRAPIEKAISDYERERAWKQRNRERALASQRAHYERNRHQINRWPVGAPVEAFYAGFWCKGTIAQRINNLKVRVQLTGGTQLDIGLRNPEGKIRRIDLEN